MRRTAPLAALAACAAFALSAQAPAAPDSTMYTVTMASNVAGHQTVRRRGDSAWTEFEFNDRGRGPSVTELVVTGADGVPTAMTITGHDYLKSPVSESFAVNAGTATWKNDAESGSGAANGFYLSANGAPEEGAVLARALLRAPGHSLAILPSGTAHIDSIESMELRDSVTRTVTRMVHYEISGLAFTPGAIWLDADGRLFAQGSSWFMVIRKGYEYMMPVILAAQRAADATRTARMAATLARHPKGVVVIRHAELFDAVHATMQPGMTVVVKGNKIVSVAPDASAKVPSGAEEIDARGRTLMPGMWDMHVHLSDDDGLFYIATGITTVRDMANDMDESLLRQKRFANGSLIGPRLLLAGFIDGPGPFAGPTKVLVDTPDSARNVVRRYKKNGYVQIKIYSSVKPELVPVIIDEAHKNGLRVSGHIPAFMTATQAVTEGFDEIQHVNFLFLNFWFDSVPDTRGPARFTAVAQKAAQLDLSSPPVQQFIALLKSHGTVLDPTVNVFEEMFVGRPGQMDPVYAPIADRLPPVVRRGFLGGGLPVPEGMDQRYRDSFAATLKMVKLLHDNGLRILAGTDALAGLSYPRELELYVQAGIPAPEVLRIATLGAARVMKLDGQVGSIEAGKMADLILVDGHPATNISDIRRVDWVMKDGAVYDPAALWPAVGIKP
jgi:hypothetical protein